MSAGVSRMHGWPCTAAAVLITALTVAGVEWFDTGAGSHAASKQPAHTLAGFSVDPEPWPGVAGPESPQDDAPRIRLEAIDPRSLADWHGMQPTAAELASLSGTGLSHADPAAREEALHLLGEAGGTIALQTLQQALHDPSLRVRRSAIRGLARVGGPQGVQTITAVLDSPEAAMRLEAIDALAELDPHGARWKLQLLLQDQDEVVREAATDWLQEISR